MIQLFKKNPDHKELRGTPRYLDPILMELYNDYSEDTMNSLNWNNFSYEGADIYSLGITML